MYIRIVRDTKKNTKLHTNASVAANLDAEAYWSYENKQPGEHEHEGSCKAFSKNEMFITIKHPTDKIFKSTIYLGLYAKNEINVKLGCSFM